MMNDLLTTSEVETRKVALVKFLEKNCRGCNDDNGNLHQAKLAQLIGVTRQAVQQSIATGSVSASIAWRLIDTFSDTITRDELTIFVREWTR